MPHFRLAGDFRCQRLPPPPYFPRAPLFTPVISFAIGAILFPVTRAAQAINCSPITFIRGIITLSSARFPKTEQDAVISHDFLKFHLSRCRNDDAGLIHASMLLLLPGRRFSISSRCGIRLACRYAGRYPQHAPTAGTGLRMACQYFPRR